MYNLAQGVSFGPFKKHYFIYFLYLHRYVMVDSSYYHLTYPESKVWPRNDIFSTVSSSAFWIRRDINCYPFWTDSEQRTVRPSSSVTPPPQPQSANPSIESSSSSPYDANVRYKHHLPSIKNQTVPLKIEGLPPVLYPPPPWTLESWHQYQALWSRLSHEDIMQKCDFYLNFGIARQNSLADCRLWMNCNFVSFRYIHSILNLIAKFTFSSSFESMQCIVEKLINLQWIENCVDLWFSVRNIEMCTNLLNYEFR